MTSHEIRETLTEVARDVEVPVVDEVAFRGRVRAERRRRTARRSLVAAAAGGVAAVVVVASLAGGDGTRGTDVVAQDPAATEELATSLPAGDVPVLVGGELATYARDGSAYAPEQAYRRLLGDSAGGLLVLDRSDDVRLVPVAPSGQLLDSRAVPGATAVRQALLSKNGLVLAFVDAGRRLHLRETGADEDRAAERVLPAGASLLAVDGTSWVEQDAGGLSVHGPDGSYDVTLGAADEPTGAELAGTTLAVTTSSGVQFFEAWNGARRIGNLGGATGSLSPDGTAYAASPNRTERANGMRPSVLVMDTTTGRQTRLRGLGGGTAALDLTWQDDERFLVVTDDPDQPGNRLLWECSVPQARCTQRLDDPSGTLEVATR